VIASLAAGVVLIGVFVAVERRVAHPMFDLSLLRIPTFAGGSIAAFAMNGSLFALFVYLVLYLQDALGLSALQTGLRLLVISGGSLIAATIAGRLSSRVPARWLISPGLVLVGAGLLLMSGLNGASSWTHLIPGFVVAGIGSGLVNPPLASTAVGVVTPGRSGMASGVNTTFRQVGIAVSIAAFASIFTASMQRSLEHRLASVPALAGRGAGLVTQIRQGDPAQALQAVPPAMRAQVAAAIRSGFAGAMNDLFLVSGGIALAGGACALALIRRKDFVGHQPTRNAGGTRPADGGEQAAAQPADQSADLALSTCLRLDLSPPGRDGQVGRGPARQPGERHHTGARRAGLSSSAGEVP
jgi:Major Facilitator Superfamily